MTSESNGSIDSVLQETRVFPPPPEFAQAAHIRSLEEYQALWDRAKDDPEGFWGEQAQLLTWFKPWDKVLEWNQPFAKWFLGGQLNAAFNCIDRHCTGPDKNKAALIWEGEPGERRVLRYQDLLRDVSKFANVLKSLGIKKGDVVAIYLPMIPELVIAILACARIGAPHMVVFSGFSAEALAGRIQDCRAKVLITADGGYRRGKTFPLKVNADIAVAECPTVENVVVYRRTGLEIDWSHGRDHWWHELEANVSIDCPPEPVDSEHPLFILYTSGSTGKPKGILHTTGGYLLGTALSSKWVFDLKTDDTFWCTADVGWVTGHSYVVYGPLALGMTCVMYEGAPNWPDEGRFWKIIEDYRVTILYTAPTAIRAFMKWGERFPRRHDLSSLRLLGTVGEPINPEAWMWYHNVIGGGRCPIVDTWWQTETGAIMISPLPGATPTIPGSATRPLPGIVPEIVTKDGQPVATNQGGFLVITQPWPSMLRTLYGDDARYKTQYWGDYPGQLLHRRRGAVRREGKLLDHGARRRRPERRRSPPLDHGDRKRPGQPSGCGRGGGGGQARRAERTGYRRLRDPRIGTLSQRNLASPTALPRDQGDRSTRSARRYPLHGRSPQDSERQDHATPVAGHRSGS